MGRMRDPTGAQVKVSAAVTLRVKPSPWAIDAGGGEQLGGVRRTAR